MATVLNRALTVRSVGVAACRPAARMSAAAAAGTRAVPRSMRVHHAGCTGACCARAFGSAAGSAATSSKAGGSEFDSTDKMFDEARIGPNEAADDNRAFSYFVLGGARLLYASTIRLAAIKFISSMSASADVLALSSVEVDVAKIPEGATTTIKWRGKPVFIRHRSPAEITAAETTPVSELKDPQPDSARVKKPDFLVVLGVCTHLGCVPINNAGDYNGWFCPCHGSHYDTSGRIRKGPAPLNLEVPQYKFIEDSKILIG